MKQNLPFWTGASSPFVKIKEPIYISSLNHIKVATIDLKMKKKNWFFSKSFKLFYLLSSPVK